MLGGIKSVWQAVTNLPQLIADKLGNFFTDIKDAILGLPSLILNGIKEIFIPDMEEMKAEFEELQDILNPNASGFAGPGGGSEGGGGFVGGGSLNGGGAFGGAENIVGKEPTDVYTDLQLGSLKLNNVKIVDYDTLKQAVEFFRPIINGFIIFLVGLYWYKEFLAFIGQAHHMGSAMDKAQDHKSKGD